MDILYVAFIFFVIALLLSVLGDKVGLGGSEMAYKIAILFLVIFVVLLVLSLLLGNGFSGGFGHTFTI